MEDVICILLMVAFVVLAALFVIGCDRIIGPDEEALVERRRDVVVDEEGGAA